MSLPKNWRSMPDKTLLSMTRHGATSEDESSDLIFDELDQRDLMRYDDRYAEAMGAPWLEPS